MAGDLLHGYLGCVRISAYTDRSRVSHSLRMRENSVKMYPKQSSLERSF